MKQFKFYQPQIPTSRIFIFLVPFVVVAIGATFLVELGRYSFTRSDVDDLFIHEEINTIIEHEGVLLYSTVIEDGYMVYAFTKSQIFNRFASRFRIFEINVGRMQEIPITFSSEGGAWWISFEIANGELYLTSAIRVAESRFGVVGRFLLPVGMAISLSIITTFCHSLLIEYGKRRRKDEDKG